MATKKQTAADKQHAKEMLLKFLKPGSTVYGIVRSVSRSGMSRRIDFYTFVADATGKCDRVFLTGYMSTLLGYPFGRGNRDGMRVDGCGMDMIFHSVMNLSYALHGFSRFDATSEALDVLRTALQAVYRESYTPDGNWTSTLPYMTLERAITRLENTRPGYTLKSEQL